MAIDMAGDCTIWPVYRMPSTADVVHFVLAEPSEGYAGLVIAAIELGRDRAEDEFA